MTPNLREAVRAALDRKALNLDVLDLKGHCSFTDYFLICTGTSSRHMQAIADAVQEGLRRTGVRPTHVEGYNQAEWILVDYLDFVVHVFSERARAFYDLARLWKSARRIPVNDHES
jgi:ribosome-associated protein